MGGGKPPPILTRNGEYNMTVIELIDLLSAMPPDATLVYATSDRDDDEPTVTLIDKGEADGCVELCVP